MTMFLCAKTRVKVRHDLGRGGLPEASTGLYPDRGEFLFAKGASVSIIRVHKTTKYSVISNEPLIDDNLSWEARGVMAYLLTKPDDWVIRNKDLENSSPGGREKVHNIFTELKSAGYIRRYRENQADGTLIWITDVYESPSINPAYGGNGKENPPMYGKPVDGCTQNRTTGLPSMVKPKFGKPVDIVNTDSLNTDSLNTDSSTTTTQIDKNSGVFKAAISLAESLAKDNPQNWAYKGFQEGWIWEYAEMKPWKPRIYSEL